MKTVLTKATPRIRGTKKKKESQEAQLRPLSLFHRVPTRVCSLSPEGPSHTDGTHCLHLEDRGDHRGDLSHSSDPSKFHFSIIWEALTSPGWWATTLTSNGTIPWVCSSPAWGHHPYKPRQGASSQDGFHIAAFYTKRKVIFEWPFFPGE